MLPGDSALLLCRYTDNFPDSLYSLKWYKDEVEFYRWEDIRDIFMIRENQQTLLLGISRGTTERNKEYLMFPE